MLKYRTLSSCLALALLLVSMTQSIDSVNGHETKGSEKKGFENGGRNSTNGGKKSAGGDILNFQLTPDMKTEDFDKPDSALAKQIKFVVKGQNLDNSKFLAIENSNGVTEMKIRITDKSIFVPGDDVAKTQNGFRRTDVIPAVDTSKAFSGITTFRHSIRLDPKHKLDLRHNYLLASIETPDGNHVYDVVYGTEFKSENDVCLADKLTSKQLRIRDFGTNILHAVNMEEDKTYHIAVTVDWTKNTLAVSLAIGNEEPKVVSKEKANDSKLKIDDSSKLEFHCQLIKLLLPYICELLIAIKRNLMLKSNIFLVYSPCPDKNDPIEARGDVPHKGVQEKDIEESIFFSKIGITSGSKNTCKFKKLEQ
ncbi:hypothetical protein BY996DRAFT_6413330 [Phakopsora pachyrhizi]|nr:hypothetical protein BY996DRAFT_6413330 [Phakopsora pachyrhizi]